MATEIKGSGDAGLFVRVWRHLKKKAIDVVKIVRKVGEDDPRRIVHSLKVGLALTFVSLFYYFRPLYDSFGVAGMWAVLTVVVVFEFSVGATLSKGLNRAFATLLAGALALGAHYLSSLTSDGEPILIGVFVFILASAATFSRFFPRIKARYDYGVIIFILTFSLVAVSGFRTDELFELAYQRLSTVVIGGLTCVFISLFICPVWAGADLHELVAKNLDKLASFLEGFGADFFKSNEGEDCVNGKMEEKAFPQGYKSVLNSKTGEEALANFARWEPGHGRFSFKYPWRQYLKISSLARQCAYSIEALNACISSKVKGPAEFREQIQGPSSRMSLESGKALTEFSAAIRAMIKPISAAPHVASAKAAAAELNSVMKTALLDDFSVLEIVPMATIASLLVDIVSHVEEIAGAVDELADKAKFKNAAEVERTPSHHQSAITPISDIDDPYIVIEICGPVPSGNTQCNSDIIGAMNGHVNK